MAINVSPIPTSSPYSPNEVNLLNASTVEAAFNPSIDYIEYVVTDNNNSFKIVNGQYNGYSFPTDGTVTSNFISSINFDPLLDIRNLNLNVGNYITHYNFYKNEANTTQYNKSLFIKEISADRTEIVIGFLYLFTSLQSVVDSLKIDNSDYFKEFYLNFSNGDICLANNIQVSSNNTLTVNLYDPLPPNININAAFWIVTKIADTLSFEINITPEPFAPAIIPSNIKGPNFNLPIKDQTNNSTDYIDYSALLQNQSISSSNQIKNLLSSSGITINIDYTDFNNFIHFSSAYQRLENFYYKVSQIEDLTNQINSWSSVTNSSSSINNLQAQITSIITNLDDYEYYLYYDSGSWSWPKSTSTLPYTLYSTGSVQVTNWLGSGENLTGILGSASLYDEKNQDSLYYSIPAYIRDDERNAPYYLFIEMMGQHYDGIWTYYKDVTNLHQADNRLDYGISKDLVAEALKSFGIKIYQNNFTSNDLYASFLGYTSNTINTTGSLPIATGSFQEYVNNYITASYESSVIPLDDYNKEIYKRIYHNLPYLAKTKGTIPGLRALINCFGVSDTVLRISEFGGRDKDTSTYDYFDQQFNYAYRAWDGFQANHILTPFVLTSSWDPTNVSSARPNNIQFRLKPYISTNFDELKPEQYIFEISGSTGYFTDLVLTYTGSGLTTSPYSGSTIDPYYQYGTLTLDIRGTGVVGYTASLYLPFFNGDWWSIMINRSGKDFSLYAGNKLYYDGYDGNQIGYLESSSFTAAGDEGWNGDIIEFFNSNGISGSAYTTYKQYQGDIQELRYWNTIQSVNSFKDYIMDPMSIDFEGENSYADHLAFRASLGATLITGGGSKTSIHPKVTGSWIITQSFSDGTSTYQVGRDEYNTNVESRFLNSPVVGLKGRVTDKIQIVSSSLPTGSVLSQYTSIEQSYPSLGSESPDVNMLEVAFSPQNEINDDIINSLGYFNIGEYIGDPRQVPSSATSYPDLNTLSNNFFQKYFDTYNLTDYVRLIKYFDNSLFKMIKDFVPARTSLTSGVVIKQHILERNKYPQPQVYNTQYQNLNIDLTKNINASLSSSFNFGENLTYEGVIDTAFISGSTGGTFNQYNTLINGVGAAPSTSDAPLVYSGSFIVNTTSPINYFAISSSILHFDNRNTQNQIEFVNGEMITYFDGDVIIGTTGLVPSGEIVTLILSSSLKGEISSNIIVGLGPVTFNIFTPYISCSNEERFSLWIQGDGSTIPTTLSQIYFGVYEFLPYSQQTWPQYYTGSTGVSTIIHSTQDEFYNGELPGTEFVVTDGELNPDNEFKYPSTTQNLYIPTLYVSNITPLENFLNSNTTPGQGEIYLWFDTGSFLNINPPGVPTAFTPG
jgi:hypothetical protein